MKIKIGVIFGGRTVEHEISVITAHQAINSLNSEKYTIVPIYISKQGLMYTGDELLKLESYKDFEKLINQSTQVLLVNNGNNINVIRYPSKVIGNNILDQIDIAFPIMHGTNGEDGAIQGYLEILNIPYVGPDVLSSSVGMDKIIARRVLKEAGIPCLDYIAFYSMDYLRNEEQYIKQTEGKIEYPLIVKAGNLGSSVGIKKAHNREELKEAIEFAMEFSDRIMIEQAITNLKEVNCSVLGDMVDMTTSICEEPIGSDEILSYKDKYVSGGKTKKGNTSGSKQGMASLKRKLPAEISEEMKDKVEDLAIKTFKVLGCSGVSRIDFLIDKDTDLVYVNEINTIPGALSYYLWEATGKTFTEELDQLIEIALKRDRQRKARVYSHDQNILALQGNKTGSKN